MFSLPKQELVDRLKLQLSRGVNDAATLDSLLKMHTALYAKLEALRAQGPHAGEGLGLGSYTVLRVESFKGWGAGVGSWSLGFTA